MPASRQLITESTAPHRCFHLDEIPFVLPLEFSNMTSKWRSSEHVIWDKRPIVSWTDVPFVGCILITIIHQTILPYQELVSTSKKKKASVSARRHSLAGCQFPSGDTFQPLYKAQLRVPLTVWSHQNCWDSIWQPRKYGSYNHVNLNFWLSNR